MTGLSRACACCGRPLLWTDEQLVAHAARLAGGEHAACACDDDCAIETSAWDADDLARAIIDHVHPALLPGAIEKILAAGGWVDTGRGDGGTADVWLDGDDAILDWTGATERHEPLTLLAALIRRPREWSEVVS